MQNCGALGGGKGARGRRCSAGRDGSRDEREGRQKLRRSCWRGRTKRDGRYRHVSCCLKLPRGRRGAGTSMTGRRRERRSSRRREQPAKGEGLQGCRARVRAGHAAPVLPWRRLCAAAPGCLCFHGGHARPRRRTRRHPGVDCQRSRRHRLVLREDRVARVELRGHVCKNRGGRAMWQESCIGAGDATTRADSDNSDGDDVAQLDRARGVMDCRAPAPCRGHQAEAAPLGGKPLRVPLLRQSPPLSPCCRPTHAPAPALHTEAPCPPHRRWPRSAAQSCRPGSAWSPALDKARSQLV